MAQQLRELRERGGRRERDRERELRWGGESGERRERKRER